ncbi:MAG: DUF2283 domain-containing protein [Candidatus Vogelbacteria bacterium]|nr:DUF2283 domain-containing protein [Candidatus Vogelbacteria bacterium]
MQNAEKKSDPIPFVKKNLLLIIAAIINMVMFSGADIDIAHDILILVYFSIPCCELLNTECLTVELTVELSTGGSGARGFWQGLTLTLHGVSIEFDERGKVLGFEILNASRRFKPVFQNFRNASKLSAMPMPISAVVS